MNRPRVARLLLGTIGLGAVAVRLVALNQPFIDSWSWRQSDVGAIARNYLQNGFNFAYPQIDWSGTAAGYVGTEFPILPFIAALCYSGVGVQEWVGRLQSLIFFALSLPFYYALVRRIFGETAAIWALIFYSFTPLTIMTSRCFMPDMPSLSLCIVGLYCFIRWLDTEHWQLYFVAAVAISLALLIKLPNAIIGVPLAYLALERLGMRALRRPAMWLFALLVLLPSLLWYSHAVTIAYRFYPHHYFGDGGFRLMPLRWYGDIVSRTLNESLTIIPVILAGAGLFFAVKFRPSRVFFWWLAALILFVVVVGYGNRHPWYQLPFVPVLAAFAGCAMSYVAMRLNRWSVVNATVAVIVGLAFGAQSYWAARKFYRAAAADLQSLGLALKKQTPAGSLIVIADYGDPTALYYGERKGWHFIEKDGIYNGHPISSADAIADLEHLRQQGATHIAFYSASAWWLGYYQDFAQYLIRTSAPVTTDPSYQIFELKR